jgi:adenylosuccinate lyase
MAEAAMIAMVGKGIGRQEAHEIMRRVSLKAADSGTHLRDQMMSDDTVKQIFKPEEIEAIMEPKNYIGQAAAIVEKTLKDLR